MLTYANLHSVCAMQSLAAVNKGSNKATALRQASSSSSSSGHFGEPCAPFNLLHAESLQQSSQMQQQQQQFHEQLSMQTQALERLTEAITTVVSQKRPAADMLDSSSDDDCLSVATSSSRAKPTALQGSLTKAYTGTVTLRVCMAMHSTSTHSNAAHTLSFCYI
jgi:hypothetical protein